jgi:hypothetical protein
MPFGLESEEVLADPVRVQRFEKSPRARLDGWIANSMIPHGAFGDTRIIC